MNGSGSGAGESAPRSRSYSLAPNQVLSPVTEHGELRHGDPPHRLGDGPEQQLLAGAGGICQCSEMGELLRTEWSWSWASSTPSATFDILHCQHVELLGRHW